MRVKAGDLHPRPKIYSNYKKEWLPIRDDAILDTEQLCRHPECNNIVNAYKRWSSKNRTKNGGYCSRDCYNIYRKEKKE